MNATNIKFVRQDEVNDVFSYININGEIDYISFPRSMEMWINDIEEYLRDKN